MRITIGRLRRLIREMLLENPSGPGITSDPTEVKGFYPYETDRGTDVHSFWYKSPGRSQGGDGDPGRPSDAEEYIGFKTKGVKPEDAAAEAAPPSETSSIE